MDRDGYEPDVLAGLRVAKIDEAREVLRRFVPDAYEAMSSEETEELVRALYWALSRD